MKKTDMDLINHATMDSTLADMMRGLAFLRDNQNLIRCSNDDRDICNDFDLISDNLAKLRKRMHPLKRPLIGVVTNLWPRIRKTEDPGV